MVVWIVLLCYIFISKMFIGDMVEIVDVDIDVVVVVLLVIIVMMIVIVVMIIIIVMMMMVMIVVVLVDVVEQCVCGSNVYVIVEFVYKVVNKWFFGWWWQINWWIRSIGLVFVNYGWVVVGNIDYIRIGGFNGNDGCCWFCNDGVGS